MFARLLLFALAASCATAVWGFGMQQHALRYNKWRLYHQLTSENTPGAAATAFTAIQPPDKKFYIETHGCQMNLSDSEVVRSVLLSAGYEACDVLEDADLILTNTCAIRENAESKIFQRLKYFNSLKTKGLKVKSTRIKRDNIIVGVLGCMAERLKDKLLEEEGVDFIAGPDAYRDLPNLLNAVKINGESQPGSTDTKAANVQLSLDETYSDITPVRLAEGNNHAFVTIQRGCNNHCAFCIVPYVRGVERSRPVQSILSEVCKLRDDGFKEVVLLGQNVNSYWDQTTLSTLGTARDYSVAPGFTKRSNTLVVNKSELSELGGGVRFGELLTLVSEIDPEMRIRFQSPHPKDFTDDLLHLVAATPNICNSLHMPAQSGSTEVLDRMKRGYTREAYMSLIQRARDIIAGSSPEGVALGLSSDFISGFCDETEAEHQDTLSLLRSIGYDQAFTYSYSRREQTYAGLFYQDNIPDDVKSRRLTELIDTFQQTANDRNNRLEVGRLHVVLVEGEAKSKPGCRAWTGRTDSNKRVIFDDPGNILEELTKEEATLIARTPIVAQSDESSHVSMLANIGRKSTSKVEKGKYVIVQVLYGRGHTLRVPFTN
jgi:tRNA A37 methylthiotransferase MiaB